MSNSRPPEILLRRDNHPEFEAFDVNPSNIGVRTARWLAPGVDGVGQSRQGWVDSRIASVGAEILAWGVRRSIRSIIASAAPSPISSVDL